MPEVLFREPTARDLVELAGNLRAADAAELEACGLGPEQAVLDSWSTSEVAFSLLLGGELAGVFGRTVPRNEGSVAGGRSVVTVWLLTTPVVDRHRFTFLRLSRPTVRRLLRGVEYAEQAVDSRYTSCLRWAAWLGFELGAPVPVGPHRASFVPIRWRAA